MTDQFEAAADLMVRDYLVLAFLVSLGALQIAVSTSGIRGLWLLPHRTLTRLIGVVLIALGIAIYVFAPLWVEGPWAAGSVVDGTSAGREWGKANLKEISGARNLNDIHGGMAGTAYTGFFILAAVLATLFAAIIGTINLKLTQRANPSTSASDKADPDTDGLDALKSENPVATFIVSLRILLKTGVDDARQSLTDAPRWSIPSMFTKRWRD